MPYGIGKTSGELEIGEHSIAPLDMQAGDRIGEDELIIDVAKLLCADFRTGRKRSRKQNGPRPVVATEPYKVLICQIKKIISFGEPRVDLDQLAERERQLACIKLNHKYLSRVELTHGSCQPRSGSCPAAVLDSGR